MHASSGGSGCCAIVLQPAVGGASAGRFLTVPGPAVANWITISGPAPRAGVDAAGNASTTSTPATIAANRLPLIHARLHRAPGSSTAAAWWRSAVKQEPGDHEERHDRRDAELHHRRPVDRGHLHP